MSSSESPEAFVQAELCITSRELTPEHISETLGIQPTRVSHKGDPLAVTLPGVADSHHRFVLQVRHAVTSTSAQAAGRMLSNAIEEVLQQVELVADRLDTMRSQVSVDLMCVYGSIPKPEWFLLPAELVSRLAALKLSLTVFLTPMEGEKERAK